MTLYAHTVEAFAPVTEPEYIAKKVRTELNRTGNAGAVQWSYAEKLRISDGMYQSRQAGTIRGAGREIRKRQRLPRNVNEYPPILKSSFSARRTAKAGFIFSLPSNGIQISITRTPNPNPLRIEARLEMRVES